jgi:hypothetical protein
MMRVALWIRVATLLSGVVFLTAMPLLWPHSAQAADGDGMLFYAAATNTTPQSRYYRSATNTYTDPVSTLAGTQATIVQLKNSPFAQESIAGYEDASGNLQIMCFDGSTWSNEWSISVGGTGTTRRFDIAYETSTGDVTVAYSRNTAAVNALAYRTKAGSTDCGTANWSGATNFPTTTNTTTGTVQWVKAARDGRGTSSLDSFIWADSNSDLGAAVWSGTAFTNFKALETSLEVVAAAQDSDDFELQYESLSGDLMVVWANSVGSNGTQGAFYSTCTGGISACTWLTPVKISTATGDDATSLDLSSDPTSDKMAFSSIGNAGNDLQGAYWSGTAWTFYANLDTTCETTFTAGSRITQTGWVTNNGNTRWVITYDDASGTALGWFLATPGATPVQQTDFVTSPTINDVRERYAIDNNPFDNSQLMLVLTDSTKKIIAERLSIGTTGTITWTNASATLGLGTIQSVPQEGFSFQYFRYTPPAILGVDMVNSTGAAVASPAVILSGAVTSDTCQASTGTLSSSSQKIRISNNTTNPAWTLSIAATGGMTSNWSSGTATYDFNDPTTSGCADGADGDSLSGQLSITPTGATITASPYCSTTGIALGSASAFNEGTTNSITLLTGSTSADVSCYWDATGIGLSQKIPAFQPPGSYSLNLTMTTVAN